MNDMINALAKLNILSLLLILFLSILGLYAICKKLRNEKNKRVECIDIINIKKLKVKNRFAYFLPISFWKKHITSNKIISYMEHEREIVIAGVISDEELQDARLKNKIFKFLKEEIKGKNIKINYKFRKNKSDFFWKKIFNIIVSKEKTLKKVKMFLKIWLIDYDYYFDIIYLNKDDRKSILTNDMIIKFKVYTHKESILQMLKYKKAKDEIKYHKKDNEKTEIEKNINLKPVWEDELKKEKLEK